jgi:hypothetical protein
MFRYGARKKAAYGDGRDSYSGHFTQQQTQRGEARGANSTPR